MFNVGIIRKLCTQFFLYKANNLHYDLLAGAPGFEPRSTDSKSGVLPLHHAPFFFQQLSDRLNSIIKQRLLTISEGL